MKFRLTFKGIPIQFYVHLFLVLSVLLLIFIISRREKESFKIWMPVPHALSEVKLVQDSNTNMFLANYTLEKICRDTTWRPGLYLNCTNIIPLSGNPPGTANPQGVSNTYNVIMICLRWAIDAGMGFVMPRIAIRSQEDIRYFSEWRGYDYLFDEKHLRDSLLSECPQLTIVNNLTNHKIIKAEQKLEARYSYGEYKAHVNQLLKENSLTPSYNNPIVIWENEQLFNWKFTNDSRPAIKSIRDAIRPNFRIRSISSSLQKMLPPIYIGIHLRVEADLVVGSYEAQKKYFIKHYKGLPGYSDIITFYVALGDMDMEDKFRFEMAQLGLNVISKWSLASHNATLKKELHSLRFDQLALLEWDVLAHSFHFFGCGKSSLSFSVANQRGGGNITNCRCHLYGEVFSAFFCCL
jgi:hypothetical protein